MKTLYVVVGNSGRHEDNVTWTVRAFPTQEQADAHRVKLNTWLMEHKVPLNESERLPFDMDNINEALMKSGLDTQAEGQRYGLCGIRYWVAPMECEDDNNLRNANNLYHACEDALCKANFDVARIDWLCRCKAGEWEELQNIRLANPRGYLREAIDKMMGRHEKEK